MEIDLAFLADAATLDASGKLSVLGIFDRISAMTFPAQHPHMCLVLRFQAGLAEAGRHAVEIVLKDPGGAELVRLDGEMHMAPGPHSAAEGVRLPHVLNLDGLVFPSAGRYAFDVRVDGVHHTTLPLTVSGVGPPADA